MGEILGDGVGRALNRIEALRKGAHELHDSLDALGLKLRCHIDKNEATKQLVWRLTRRHHAGKAPEGGRDDHRLTADGGHEVAEADAAAINALRLTANRARLPVECSHRDLFRNPLRADELAGVDGVVLDPPRAGARTQVEQVAGSGVERVVYISCNPSSWARDAVQLKEAGYRLAELRPVGQFRWSTHVELASLFVK